MPRLRTLALLIGLPASCWLLWPEAERAKVANGPGASPRAQAFAQKLARLSAASTAASHREHGPVGEPREWVIAGQVVNTNGEPVAGVDVSACGDAEVEDCDEILASDTTDERGEFTLRDGSDWPAFVLAEPDEGTSSVVVAYQSQGDLVLVVGAKGRVFGRIFAESSVADHELDVGWISVTTDEDGDRETGFGDVDEDGAYQLDVPDTEVIVRAWAETDGPSARLMLAAHEVRVGLGQKQRLDLVLEHPLRQIRGRLVSNSWRPVMAHVTATAVGEQTPLHHAWDASDYIGADGRFSVWVGEPGSYRLRFEDSGQGRFGGEIAQAIAEAGSDPAPITVVTARRDIVSCRLRDSAGATVAISRYRVIVESPPEPGQAITIVSTCGLYPLAVSQATIQFVWVRGSTRAEVVLGDGDRAASMILKTPQDACELVLPD